MTLLRSKSHIGTHWSLFILVYSLLYFVTCKPTNFGDENKRHDVFRNGTSNSTGKRRLTAMDMILAVNRNTPVTKKVYVRRPQMDEERVKRMNVTKFSNGTMVKTNTSVYLNGTDVLLQVNMEKKVADDLFEGDILLDPLDPDDYKLIRLVDDDKKEEAENILRKRQASRELKHLWLNRVVPYVIDSSLYHVYNLIESTVRKFNMKSCVTFARHRGENQYVIFKKGKGCVSNIGRAYHRSGPQQISLDTACQNEPVIMHEMLHAVGFHHEQSRPDRDNYIKILWENVPDDPLYKAQFHKYSHGVIDQFGMNYNYHSIMQYGNTAFSKNDGDTMQSIDDPKISLGSDLMSNEDIIELNTLYDCKTKKFNSWTSWSSWSPCDDRCFKNKQRYCYGSNTKACGGHPNAYGIETETVRCSADVCPVKIQGHWGAWSPFGYCTEKCNEGVRVRTRECDNPAPENGGKRCQGLNTDSIVCVNPRCSLGKYDTDFRDGHLGMLWKNDIYDTPGFDWVVGYGPTITEGTGPSNDHLGQNGYYAYVESSGRARKDSARLYTEFLPKTNATCLSFYYHMHGPTTGRLSLSMYPVGVPDPTALFYKLGPQGNQWHFQRVNLTSASTYQLVFDATVANGDYSDIAIDDLFFDEGSCDCQDNFRNCLMWAKKNDCAISYDFMNRHCRRSCNFCGCQDNYENCGTWAKENYCISSYNFMINHCKKSCNFCDCDNKNPSCKTWAANGSCKTSFNYMESSCSLACRMCVCHNNNIKCDEWAANGHCTKTPVYMRENCKRSCGLCKVPSQLGY